MSDEFDKEAEREKLRKKFERDEKKREHTQHMSELLLKGATMTNSHCDACGDPIFRHNGQEFCPTCSREGTGNAGGATADATAAAETETGEATTGESGSTATTRSGSTAAAGSAEGGMTRPEPEGSPTEIEIDDDGATGTAEPAAGNGTGEGGSTASGAGRGTGVTATDAAAAPNVTDAAAAPNVTDATTPPSGPDTPDRGATRPTQNPEGNTPAEDLRAARESLARTARRFAEAADGTDDPRRAREHLQAAREAAEAIAALDR